MNSLSNLFLTANFAVMKSALTPNILIVFAILFLIIGLSCLALFPKVKRNAENYKKKQLDLYKEQNRRSNVQYENTGMYLPPWEKVKFFLPLFLSMVFIIIGVSLLIKFLF